MPKSQEPDQRRAEVGVAYAKVLTDLAELICDLLDGLPGLESGSTELERQRLLHRCIVATNSVASFIGSPGGVPEEAMDGLSCAEQLLNRAVDKLISNSERRGGATAERCVNTLLPHGGSAYALGRADTDDPEGVTQAMAKKTVATIFGPVGWLVQDEGQFPKMELAVQTTRWKEITDGVNSAIAAGKAFVGGDRIARQMPRELTEEHLATLSIALEDLSRGGLYLVPTHHREGS